MRRMDSMARADENTSPNLENKEERKMKSALSWNLILSSGDSSAGGTLNKRRKKSVSRLKSRTQSGSATISSSGQSSLSACVNSSIPGKSSKESILRKRIDWRNNFQINRIFFEEFPIYRKEYQFPANCCLSADTPAQEESENSIRRSLKLVPRRFHAGTEHASNYFLSFFGDKKVCLLGDEEYLFHTKRQLVLKLRWYGARTLDYYSSRADYVVCSSTYNEVMSRLNKLSASGETNSGSFREFGIDQDKVGCRFENLRGVRIGHQVKLTELELLEFLGEDLEIALGMLNVSEGPESPKRLELLKPKTMWELVGNRDCADELYDSLLCLRLQCEDQDLLESQGLGHPDFAWPDEAQRSHQMEAMQEEPCGIFVLISPGNIGSQVCAELAAFGCGYDVKIYRGSDVVEPIVKQWKKGHFFKLFEDSESPPVCTIMTDCSGVIKAGDILKIKNSYYSTAFLRGEGGGGGGGGGGTGWCHVGGRRERSIKLQRPQLRSSPPPPCESPQETGQQAVTKRHNPGAILFIIEETSEAAQFLLGHCNNGNRSFGCSRSHTLYKLDGGLSTGQVIKVLRFNGLTKSAVACKLFTRFRNPALISILIGQFGPNMIKTSQMMHWIHLADSVDLGSVLSCISLSYTPILFDSILEIPLLMIQKCLLSQEEASMREEIWSFCSIGLTEDQVGALESLLKVVHDLVTSIVSCLDLREEHDDNSCRVEDHGSGGGRVPKYASGFDFPQAFAEERQSLLQESSSFVCTKFLQDLTEMDSRYQIEKQPHLVFHSPGSLCQQNQSPQSQIQLGQSHQQQQQFLLQQDHRGAAICESYFSTLYSVALFSFTAILKQNAPNRALYSERVINLVNDKLLKYSPINTGYDKNLTNYYHNKRQDLSSTWRCVEFLLKKQTGGPVSTVTWRSASVDSSIPNLLYKRQVVGQAKYRDIVSYVPSRIPRLNVRIPEVFQK